MKIEISHPENISLPPQKSFKSPEQTQHYGNNPNPSRKFPNTSESISTPPGKISTSLKVPLAKNSITITEIISNTLTKSQPFPEKSQPLMKNSQSLLKKSQPPTP